MVTLERNARVKRERFQTAITIPAIAISETPRERRDWLLLVRAGGWRSEPPVAGSEPRDARTLFGSRCISSPTLGTQTCQPKPSQKGRGAAQFDWLGIPARHQ